MDDLLNTDQRALLVDELVKAFVTEQPLRAWLQQRLPTALPHLAAGSLVEQLGGLFKWASAEDGLRTLLQKLADHPPAPDLPAIVTALSVGEIRARAPAAGGAAPLPHQSLLVADRPFVNRVTLRQHLQAMAKAAPGARRILVIEGGERSGKSFAVSLAFGCQGQPDAPMPIDINDFAASAASVDARKLAELIVGDANGAPPYDPTKEDEAVPHLVAWLGNRLRAQERWVLIDHCNRPVLTRGARSLLVTLAAKVQSGYLPTVRLVLVDFDRNDLPAPWRLNVLHDRAALPEESHVAEWCRQFAAAQRRKHGETQPAQWARSVFTAAGTCKQEDGSWHIAFEHELRQVADTILACEELA
jgi:hypothetical protein